MPKNSSYNEFREAVKSADTVEIAKTLDLLAMDVSARKPAYRKALLQEAATRLRQSEVREYQRKAQEKQGDDNPYAELREMIDAMVDQIGSFVKDVRRESKGKKKSSRG